MSSIQLKQNDKIRETVNLNQYIENGYDGSSVHLVVFDEKGIPHDFMKDVASAPFCSKKIISHATSVTSVANQMLPKLKITMLYSSDECREYFKQIANTVDIVNISRSANKDLAEYSWGFLKYYDIPVFASSGNDGNAEVNYPSAFDWTISVGAFSNGGVVDYSNFGYLLDCVGFTDVYIPTSSGNIIKFNGTSASSPQSASTFCAYVDFVKKNLNRKVTRQEAFEVIHKNTLDLYETGRDDKSGYGLYVLKDLEKLKEELLQPIEQEPEIIITPPSNPSTPSSPTLEESKGDDQMSIPETKKLYHVQTLPSSKLENAELEAEKLKELGFSVYTTFANQVVANSTEELAKVNSDKLTKAGIKNVIVYY